jgi:ubiquinone/menaquinone biosynthesis C-methylase UbiE
MAAHVDLYDSTYSHFDDQILEEIRKEVFGKDIGQNSWLTLDEFDRFIAWLEIEAGNHVLEVASGSGGPAGYLAKKCNCHVTGIDVNENGIITAARNAEKSDLAPLLDFRYADANLPLPFNDSAFDSVICIDAMNHFPNRLDILHEWYRVLRSGQRALFTDPVVITGPVTNKEIELRSSIDLFLFVPPGVNENLISKAGFKLVMKEDVSENASLVSKRWYNSRQKYKEELLRIEGKERFEGLQKFFNAVHILTSQKRLSRIVYLIEK